MEITFDQVKRAKTMSERGLDFAIDAPKVFAGRTATFEDIRRDYGETRLITAGWVDGRMVMMVWTQRGTTRHIISMRHCHAREEKKLKSYFTDA